MVTHKKPRNPGFCLKVPTIKSLFSIGSYVTKNAKNFKNVQNYQLFWTTNYFHNPCIYCRVTHSPYTMLDAIVPQEVLVRDFWGRVCDFWFIFFMKNTGLTKNRSLVWSQKTGNDPTAKPTQVQNPFLTNATKNWKARASFFFLTHPNTKDPRLQFFVRHCNSTNIAF